MTAKLLELKSLTKKFGGIFAVYDLSFHVNEGEAWESDLHMINKLRLIGGWEVNPKLSVFAGLTLNVFVSEVNDGEHISTGSFYDHEGDDTWVRMWPGFVAGVQF